MSLTRSLVEAIESLDYGRLDDRDHLTVRSLVLDHLGVVANGAHTETATTTLSYVSSELGDTDEPRLPVIGTDTNAPAVAAALVNAVAGHCIEFDDTHSASSSHPGVVVIPAVMAATRLSGADSEAFMMGLIVGYEVMCRVGRAANPPSHYERHFHPTGTVGTIGAAAAAGSIFGLDTEQMVSALGIACDMAAGSMQFIVDGSWTKRLHPGVAVRSGIDAARLARSGFIGPEDGIGGERGFLAGYSADAKPDLVLAEWGTRPLEVNQTGIKAHACCRYNQASVDALLELRTDHGLTAADIDTVTLGVPAVAVDIVVEPASLKRRPKSVIDAQFSLPYAGAVALARGRAGLAEYDESMMSDDTVVALMDRVEAVLDADIDRAYPEHWQAWAEVATFDGRRLRADVADPKGDPGNPFEPAELRAKFDDLAGISYSPSQRDAIADAVDQLGEPGSFNALVDALGSSDQ